jgi:hypothetical protein
MIVEQETNKNQPHKLCTWNRIHYNDVIETECGTMKNRTRVEIGVLVTFAFVNNWFGFLQ